MYRNLTLSAVLAFGLGACTTYVDDNRSRHGNAQYRSDGVIVIQPNDGGYYDKRYRDNGNGQFCPPGHAKKGWC